MLQLEPMALDGRHGSHISVLACIYAGARSRTFCMCAYCNVACAQCGGWVPYTRRRRVLHARSARLCKWTHWDLRGDFGCGIAVCFTFHPFPPKTGTNFGKVFPFTRSHPTSGRGAAPGSIRIIFQGFRRSQIRATVHPPATVTILRNHSLPTRAMLYKTPQ